MTSCVFQKKRAFAFVWLQLELGGALFSVSCAELAHKALCFQLILGVYSLKQAD